MIVCQRDHIDATCSDLRRIGDSIAPKNTVLESETAETVVDPRPINISPVVARRSTPACCSQPEAAIVKAEAQRPSRRSQWKPHASDHPRATLHADPPVAGTPCRPEVPRYFPGAPRRSNTRNHLAFLKVGKALGWFIAPQSRERERLISQQKRQQPAPQCVLLCATVPLVS